MQGEYLSLHHSSQWQLVKELREVLPHVGISVLALALIIKAVHLCDLTTLVVAPENGNPVSISDLECDQQCDRFHAVIAPIDVIAHKQVISVRAIASDLEQLDQIVELAVDVATNRDRTSDGLHVLFARNDLLALLTQLLDLDLCEG